MLLLLACSADTPSSSDNPADTTPEPLGPCDALADWFCDEGGAGDCAAYCELDTDRQVFCDETTCYEATGTTASRPCNVRPTMRRGCETCQEAIAKGCGAPW